MYVLLNAFKNFTLLNMEMVFTVFRYSYLGIKEKVLSFFCERNKIGLVEVSRVRFRTCWKLQLLRSDTKYKIQILFAHLLNWLILKGRLISVCLQIKLMSIQLQVLTILIYSVPLFCNCFASKWEKCTILERDTSFSL